MQQKEFCRRSDPPQTKKLAAELLFLIFSYNLMTISDICSKGLGNHFSIRYNKSN